MKKLGVAFILGGALATAGALLVDLVGPGAGGGFGAVQVLGIDVGIVLALVGAGLLASGAELRLAPGLRRLPGWLLERPPAFWITATFLALFVVFFFVPVFTSRSTIQYMTRYIPYDWVSYIGNDIVWTVERIQDWLTGGPSPFSGFFYPPLTVLVFAPLILLGYPAYYHLVASVTLACFVVAALLVPLLVTGRKQRGLVMLFFVTGLVSYGLQFELDRGQFNLIAFTSVLLAVYLFHYHPHWRPVAYALFAFGVHLKMYPIIFLLMFVEDWRDWKATLRRMAGLFALNFALLFVLGTRVFTDFVRNLASAQLEFQSSRREDLSITGFVSNLLEDGMGLVPASGLPALARHGGLMEVLLLLAFAACVAAVVIRAYRDGSRGLNPTVLALCAIGALIIPSASLDYKLPMLVAPVSILLASLPAAHRSRDRLFSAALVTLASAAYWSTLYPFTVKPYLLSRNFPALFIMMISITLLHFVLGGNPQTGPADPMHHLEE